jgi:hypothetical protein
VTDYFVEKEPSIKTPAGMTNIKYLQRQFYSSVLNILQY